MKMFNSTGVTSPLEVARKRLAAAEKSVETAKDESRSAKRKRKEAKLAARRAKKQLKRAREELDDAKRGLAQEEANDALKLKIVRAQKRTTSRRVRLSPVRAKAKRRSKRVAKDAEAAVETSESTPAETVPVEAIPAGDFQISQATPEISSANPGAEVVPAPTEQIPHQNTDDWRG